MRDSFQSRPSFPGPEPTTSSRPNTRARLIALAATLAILVLTLWPGAAEQHAPRACPILRLVCGDKWAVDLVLNLLLFVPIGFGYRRTGLGLLAATGGATALSLLVELAQLGLVPGRDPSLRDLLANAAGAMAGAWLGGAIGQLLNPEPGAARRYAIGWVAGVTTFLLGAAYVLGPSLPDSLWYGQHRAELSGYDRFEGDLLAAGISGRRLLSGPLLDNPRPASPNGDLELAARITAPPGPTRRLAPILSVFDGEQRRVALLGQVGHDLAFAARIRAEDLGFEGLLVRHRNVFAHSIGDSIEVSGRRVGGVIETAVGNGSGASNVVRHAVGPADAWRLVLPREMALSPLLGTIGNALVLILLFTPLGWWSRAAGARRLLLAGVVPALAALWPAPLGFPAAAWPCWAGVLAGLWCGWRGLAAHVR